MGKLITNINEKWYRYDNNKEYFVRMQKPNVINAHLKDKIKPFDFTNAPNEAEILEKKGIVTDESIVMFVETIRDVNNIPVRYDLYFAKFVDLRYKDIVEFINTNID